MKPCKETKKVSKRKDGYYRCWPGTHLGESVYHRYLYKSFHNVSLDKDQVVRHICNNVSCVEITHLVIGTQQDNIMDSVKAGTHNTNAKITKEDALQIRKEYKSSPLTFRELGKKYGISESMVSAITKGKYWK